MASVMGPFCFRMAAASRIFDNVVQLAAMTMRLMMTAVKAQLVTSFGGVPAFQRRSPPRRPLDGPPPRLSLLEVIRLLPRSRDQGLKYGTLVGSAPQACARYLVASFCRVPSFANASMILSIVAALAEPFG